MKKELTDIEKDRFLLRANWKRMGESSGFDTYTKNGNSWFTLDIAFEMQVFEDEKAIWEMDRIQENERKLGRL